MNQNNEQWSKGKTATGAEGGDKSKKGFASMAEDKQKEIASMGGKASHESGNAHQFNSETGREAGRTGGQSKEQNTNNKETEDSER